MDILQRAIHRRKKADEILEELKLLERWAEIGDAYLVGAASYNLIVNPDIDIETFCEAPSAHAVFNFLTTLSSNPNVIEIKYHNYMDSSFNGLYFKLLYRYDLLNIWNIDMWLFPSNHKGPLSRDLVQVMSEVLTDEKRKRILAIKEDLVKQQVKYPSILVYQAVIDNKIQNTNKFLDWVKSQESDKLTTWKPNIKG